MWTPTHVQITGESLSLNLICWSNKYIYSSVFLKKHFAEFVYYTTQYVMVLKANKC